MLEKWKARRAMERQIKAEVRSRISAITTESIDQYYYTLIAAPGGLTVPFAAFTDTDLERLLKASAWSWAAVSGNARAMSQLQPTVQVWQGKARRWAAAPDGHPLWAFVDEPLGADARLPYWSWSRLIELIAIHRYLVGNAFLVPQIIDGGRRIYSVMPLLKPQSMTADVNEWGLPVAFLYDSTTSLSPAQVVNIMAPSPGSWWRGLAPLQAALNAIDLDYYSGERQKWAMRNKVAPGLIVAVETPMGLTGKQRGDLQTSLTAGYQAAENSGKPWVIGGAAKIHDPPKSEELQYLDTRRFARDEILAVIGMPPPVAGVMDNAILANFSVATELWWNGYLFPVLSSIYEAINSQLVQRVYGTGVRIWYELAGSDIALTLLARRAAVAQQLVTLGYATNVASAAAGLEMPEHPALDIPNSAMVVSGRINPDGSPVKAPKETRPPTEAETQDAEGESGEDADGDGSDD